MGQKIHPTGFRLSVTRNWTSRWYSNSKSFPQMLKEDIEVREYLKKKLAHASVGRVVIERPAKNARVTVYSARPGVVIGKMGVPVHVNIEEIRKPEIDAQLIADSIAQQLEKRIMFRRAMKRAMQNAMRLGAQGIKIMSSGRLNGAEIARREWYREGRVPLHTLRADIDYGTSEAKTTYGIIGIKVWVFKGESLSRSDALLATPEPAVDDQRKPRRAPAGKPRTEGDGESKPVRRGPTKAAEGVKPEVKPDAPAATPKTPVKRIRKAPAKAEGAEGAAKEGKE
jgi:small subunit ribosomal protein S3